jgi:nucleotide-binding universal stress UspA family protein
MRVLIYVGPAPSREAVIQISTQFVQQIATHVTLLSCGGADKQALLDDAQQRLAIPAHVAVDLRLVDADPQQSIVRIAREQPCDLVIFGRLNQPVGRLLPGPHSKAIAQRLEPSVLRVHGVARPIQRMLLASGGDHHTFVDANMAARIAAPLGASVTLLHVLSQQSLIFDGFSQRNDAIEAFLQGNSPEAHILRNAAHFLKQRNITTAVRGRVGPVLDEILAELRVGGYDLLVVGAHQSTSTLDRILLENITGEILDVSPLPVLVVKNQQRS